MVSTTLLYKKSRTYPKCYIQCAKVTVQERPEYTNMVHTTCTRIASKNLFQPLRTTIHKLNNRENPAFNSKKTSTLKNSEFTN